MPENPASYRVVRTKSYLFNKAAYFMTSFIVGVLAAGLLGSKFTTWTGYTDRPLDALGAVVASAVTIKVLTFINSQDLSSLFGLLSRLRGGGSNGNK
ncbi:putative holin [Klebsiella pneumoniae]